MSEGGRPKSSAAVRPPLGDATYRINNNLPNASAKSPKSHGPEANGARIDPVVSLVNPDIEMSDEPTVSESHAHDGGHICAAPPSGPQPRYSRTRAVQETDPSKRVSQASTAPSSNRSSNCSYKTQVGPWQLGKTLGKGSSARVRLCRHRLSGELAAVKIIPKKTAYLIQHGSLAALHQYDDSLPDRIDGEMRVPMSIEREVAILKLVDHPNVMKVYDIWENRSEIYLVLEYVDKGDLFDYINTNGRLNEEAAMYFFRQIMSAMQHCHAFNICHRDLKPENILLNAENQIKIADFGMAALHQSEGHRLETACGSPHYAAPELLKNKHYRGDRADVWSMGVILYAILAARLPFDDPDIRVLLARTKKGIYEMPEFLSPEAKDLICRMLQVNPDIRISLKDMWRHPLIRKYDYLDNFGTKAGQPRNIREGFDYTPLKPQEVDDHLVRQLRSLWHMFSEHQIKLMLLDSSKNDQKLFYWLLQQYRQKQLENFLPEVSQSPSDYHHLHQPAWKKRVSTCEFTQPRAHGHGRSISKFTVISNVPDTDVGTVRSYDPYNSSRPMRANSQVSHARIVVHRKNQPSKSYAREDTYTSQITRTGTRSTGRHTRVDSQRTAVSGRFPSSRGSMGSVASSRQGGSYSRPASRRKRRVDFSQARNPSVDHRRGKQSVRRGAMSNASNPLAPRQAEKASENVISPPKLRKHVDIERSRIVSAPPRTPRNRADADGLDYLSRVGETIRVVNSPTATSPVPAPLNVRKKHSHHPASAVEGAGLRQAYMHGAIHDNRPPAGLSASRISSQGTDSIRKKKSWFKRSAREDDQREASIRTKQTCSSRETTDTRPCTTATQSTIDYSTEATSPSRHHSGLLSPPQKKKSFGLLFWKSNKAENRMSIAGPDYEDSPSPGSRKTGRSKASHHGDQSIAESDSGVRKIEVHQTWLARLFGVKPATSYMCLVVSRKRARQELAILLKDWRDMNRDIQERGAASSFQKVVDTIKSVFGSRHLLVTDKRKSKMMIKTLNS
ncbi:BR serine/threonine-protein kinase [Verticillium alfalfae VaMs.102]|uniref:non-specific serine/threonine protein kinase n=1 Tax=Verticillium alfalfae (strain VaMs.102 / ATCC MYA-4576 / FGSC 10136) TaxID=526221 RepID=C9SBD3_VERA1|nr:BR serine/threonine-protein kinase [Verticillium alfalfae VaMs.102]EEY15667.1 BR serine/threonine-protein kinase [Verticillium alfalfae VaMs.102]